MPSQVSDCPVCGRPGRWGFDDDWCHEETEAALNCLREGFAARHLEGALSDTALLSKRQED